MLLEEAVGDLHVTATSPLNATSTKPLIQKAMPALRELYNEKTTKPLIQKAMPALRELYNEKTIDQHFKPISFSFGPLHHVKKLTQGSTFEKAEKFKRRLAAMFISYSGNQKEVLYENVKKEIHSLRNCYDPIEVVDWEDEELACMFLVDGCALLHFILLAVQGTWEELGGKNDQCLFMIHDLFLLENQLPFQLLEILIYSCIEDPHERRRSHREELKDSIAKFINKPLLSPVKEISIPIYDQGDSQTHHCQRQRQEEPVHLLALLRRKLIGQGVKSKEKPKEKDGLLEKLMRKWCSSDNKIRELPSLRNVKELKAKGIRFKQREKIDGITDIDFNHRSCMPTLRLAPILNQLPFQLLEILIYSCIEDPHERRRSHREELKDSIAKFINKPLLSPVKEISIPIYDQGDSQTHHCQRQRQEEPVHLLALLRRKLIGQGVKSKEKPKEKDGLLEKLMRKWCSSDNKIRELPSLRNVKELKTKGIRFKPKEKIDGVTDIDFNHRSCMPTLRLAPILVEDQTIPILLNLIAYEMCSDINECEITSYIAFLESLIDSGEDVKELRDARVLFNKLGSDENLAEMFNKISKYLAPNPEKYKGLKGRIQDHCDLVWASDVAYFYNTYFRTPWSFLVFLSAVAGLLMTALQTYRSFNKPTGSTRH
ncbi:hypothetical protein SLEP1_g21894 [Rubroshorea leprosula]|uniref:Uncharacterized protein n=1 Tax=Rubroshorea leprosula TaxID=152421 RepID=A0AAV5J7H8_9ROSI|nr:hypothetical protein SLEP1_g21894 [Rubroshorea leprosula]